MDSATWIAFGMFVVAAAATGLNLWKARKDTHTKVIQESAAVIKARAEMKLGSIEAAERVVAMYGAALTELQKRVDFLEKKVDDLEAENNNLQGKLQSARHLLKSYETELSIFNEKQQRADMQIKDINTILNEDSE